MGNAALRRYWSAGKRFGGDSDSDSYSCSNGNTRADSYSRYTYGDTCAGGNSHCYRYSSANSDTTPHVHARTYFNSDSHTHAKLVPRVPVHLRF